MLPATFNTKKRQRGFTLIELLIAIGISLVLASSAAAPIYGNLQGSTQLLETGAQIVQTLRTARERAVSGMGNLPHGVYLDIDVEGDDSVILYRGPSYALRDSVYDRTITLASTLTLTSTTDADITFSQGIGIPSETGSITITHEILGSRTIALNEFGIVEEE